MNKSVLNLLDFPKKLLLDLLFPKKCVGCGLPGNEICFECCKKIELLTSSVCPSCGKLTKFNCYCLRCRRKLKSKLKGIFVTANYDQKVVKEIIHGFKYSGFIGLSNVLGGLMSMRLKKAGISLGGILIIPVPLHAKKEQIRGFNQSQLIAEYISKKLEIRMIEPLKRIRGTKSQINLPKEERSLNVNGAFCCINVKEVIGRNILLIDDVYTTGATLSECAKVLSEAGAKHIWALVAAKRM